MAEYLEYMQNEGLAKGRARLVAGAALTGELLQAMKNRSAPTVSGGGGWSSGSGFSGSGSGAGAVGSSSYSGPLKLGKMKGGKVAPLGNGLSQGWGKSNIRYAAGRHTGQDFRGKSGSTIRAAAAGVVTRTGWEGAYGNATHIRHADGTTTFYGHQSGIGVKAGQKVKAGQAIGAVGNTGRSFGAHLHFEVRKVDKYGGDVNPSSWFSSR